MLGLGTKRADSGPTGEQVHNGGPARVQAQSLTCVGIYSHVHGTRDRSRDMQAVEWRQLGYETECPNGGNWEFSV